jgi:hypothetical protein
MAWQTPTHSCGHEGEQYQAYGPCDGRQRRLEQIERHPCPACRSAQAQAQGVAAGLPPLTGSEKQIAWAGDIRARLLPTYEQEIAAAKKLLPESRDLPQAAFAFELIDLAEQRLAKRQGQSEARWWIDNRDMRTPLNAIIAEREEMKRKLGVG